LKQSVEIAANLAVAETKLGKHRDAATHLAFALRTFPVKEDPKKKERIEALLADAKTHVAELTIEVEDGATIRVDGEAVGVSPLGTPIYIEPGDRSIEAENGARARGARRLTLAAGQSQRLRLILVAAPGSATASASATGMPTAQPSASSSASSMPPSEARAAWPAIALGSVAAIGIGVGVGTTVAGVGSTGDVEGTPCLGAPETCPAVLSDAVDKRNMLVGVGAVGFSVGAAALAGMIVYLVWPEPDGSNRASAVRVTPWAARGGGGLSVGGSF
jgi:hypothetical protein